MKRAAFEIYDYVLVTPYNRDGGYSYYGKIDDIKKIGNGIFIYKVINTDYSELITEWRYKGEIKIDTEYYRQEKINRILNEHK